MKEFTFYKRIILGAALFASTGISAQLTLDFDLTPDQMAQNLVGVGVEIFNAQVIAADSSYAYYFSDGTEPELPTGEGILLTTGRAQNAIGPNDETGLPLYDGDGNCLNCFLYDNNFPGSPLLTAANGGLPTFDACQFEFDIVPQGDSLTFDFTFGSEEYLEWVGSSFNDVFGFFVSGPNVGVDVNIALIPGTNDPVAINTVNHITNTQFFYHNENPPGIECQYDGLTVGLQAAIGNLIPCETYHIKLIIADGSDRIYDSAVFINKISSNPITITTSTVGGTEFMVEGCNDGTVLFESTFIPDEDLEVNFTLTGSAEFGIDYITDPDLNLSFDSETGIYTLIIPAGQNSVSFDIFPLADGIEEGAEVITITVVDALCDDLLFQNSVDFIILDEIDVSIDPADPIICNGQCVTLEGDALVDGMASFEWTGPNGFVDTENLTIEVCPTETSTYTLTSTLANCVVSAEATVTVNEPEITFDVTNVTCIDGETGEIRPTILNATPPYDYSWTFNGDEISTSEELIGVGEGTYCLTIVDSEGCTTTECVEVVEEDILQIADFSFSQFTCSPISCFGACDGSITISVTGGTGDYTFTWVDAGGIEVPGDLTATDLCAGTYTVTVTDELDCEVSATYTLVQPEELDIEVVGTVDILCSGEETGVATVTSSGGCPPYFYNWSHDPNLTTPVATGLGAGEYEVSVTDANGCQSAGSVTIVINEPGEPVTITVEEVGVFPGGFNVSCPDATDGFIDITVSGGIPDYLIQWTHQQTGNTFFTEDISDLPCGTYTVVVTDSNDCVATETIVLECVPPWEISGTTEPNPCAAPDAGEGEISLTIGGSHGGPYTVEWEGPSCPCSGETITGLDSGVYTATITDVLGCETTVSFNIGTNDEFSVTGVVTDADCGEACTGSIELTVDPSDYDFLEWSGPNGFTSTDEDIFDLCAGTYEVLVITGECEETFSFTVNEPDPIVIEFIDIIPPLCFGQNNGSVTASASGGVGDLTYEWLPSPECFFAGSSNAEITNLFECTYTVVVTDETGCTAEASIFLDAPQVMDIFVSTTNFDGGFNISCFEANDGQISVTVSGGTPDCDAFDPECYNYDWTSCDPVNVPGASFQDNLSAGTYCVLVTDANGCVATTQIPITQPDPIESSGTVSDYNGFGVSCNGACDGTITPNITGGSGNYVFYSWVTGNIGDNDPNAETLTDLCAGIYELQVIDTNGCEDLISFELTEPEAIEIEVETVVDVECNGEATGSIVVSASGGAGGFTYVWNEGAFNGTVLTDLPAGTYDLVVTDANGCEEEVSVTIEEPEPVSVNLTAPLAPGGELNIACLGDATGSISAIIEGGTPGYDIEWTGPGITNPNDQNQTGLIAGTYTITVIDANGCETEETIELTEPEEEFIVSSEVSLYPSGEEISCFGACDGFINLTVTGGIAPYTYLWEIGDVEGEFATTQNVEDLCPGEYEVLVVDANGCDTLLQFVVNEPPQLLINAEVSDFNGSNTSCAETCDASITIAPSGGTPDYTIEWILNEEVVSAELVLEELCEGDVVTVIVTDAADCETEETFVITGPEPVFVQGTATQISCDNTADGSITIEVGGGTGSLTIEWDNGQTGVTELTDLGEGTYCVTVTDENGCEAEACFEILEPLPLDINLNVTAANCGACDGVIDLTVTGGNPPLTIEWSGPTEIAEGTLNATDLCVGVYSVTVTDANGCDLSDSIEVEGPLPIELTGTSTQPLCFGDCDGVIDVSLVNAVAPVEVVWTDANGIEVGDELTLTGICEGVFDITITDADGCEETGSFTIVQPDSITINGFSPVINLTYNISGFGATDGSIETDITGGTPDYELSWSGPTAINDDEDNPTGLAAGEYTLVVIDENGCRKDTVIVVVGPDDLTLPTGFTPNGDGANDNYIILGIDLHPVNTFKVFNRWGNLVYEKANYQNEWDGRNNSNEELPDGTYFVLFEASDRQFGTYVDLRR